MPPTCLSNTKYKVGTQSIYNQDYLRAQASWIRNILDPLVARDGPEVLDCKTLQGIDDLVCRLSAASIPLEDLQYSRVHMAIREIAGIATRWPAKVVDQCDKLLEVWTIQYGNLTGEALSPLIYGPMGRLHGISGVEDYNDELLLRRWEKTPGLFLDPARARRIGDAGFTPGDWWLKPIFAFYDGVLDSCNPKGGTVTDPGGTYALLLTADTETWGSSFDVFHFRPKTLDKGIFRLISGTEGSRRPVRILRSHAALSFWGPRVGVRYDGLHVVTGWRAYQKPGSINMHYEITFRRLPTKVSIEQILSRPLAEEVEDYREYKRLRREARDKSIASGR